MGIVDTMYWILLCTRHWAKYFMCMTLILLATLGMGTIIFPVLRIRKLRSNVSQIVRERDDLNPSLMPRLELFTKEKAIETISWVEFIYCIKQPSCKWYSQTLNVNSSTMPQFTERIFSRNLLIMLIFLITCSHIQMSSLSVGKCNYFFPCSSDLKKVNKSHLSSHCISQKLILNIPATSLLCFFKCFSEKHSDSIYFKIFKKGCFKNIWF